MLALLLGCLACTGKTPIEGQLSRDVKKDPFNWNDPGAEPDGPVDSGRPESDGSVDLDGGPSDAAAPELR